MRTNIHAYTQTVYRDGYPGYISVNREQDGKYNISVRSEGATGQAQLDMGRDELKALADSINKALGEENA